MSDDVTQSQTSVGKTGRLCQLSRWISTNKRRGARAKKIDVDAAKRAKITNVFAAGAAAVVSTATATAATIMKQQVEAGRAAGV